MIIQRFFPIDVYIDGVLEQCNDSSFQAYINSTVNVDFVVLDSMIFEMENDMFLLFDELARQTKYTEVDRLVKRCSNEQKLFLNLCFDVIRLYPSKHTQYMPLFPQDDAYKNFFAFVQFTYEQFKKNCLLKKLLLTEIWYNLRYEEGLEIDNA